MHQCMSATEGTVCTPVPWALYQGRVIAAREAEANDGEG
jgi:hypothetical protein